jgi:hypothetical protein
MRGYGIAGTPWSAGRRLRAALWMIALGFPAYAAPTVTINVTGGMALGVDGSDLFGGFEAASLSPFAYQAKFTYDLSDINGSALPNLFGYTGLTNATITALGNTYSISDPNGTVALSSAATDNFYAQRASNGLATLDVFAAPTLTSGSPIAPTGTAQSFSFAAQPFLSPSPGNPNTRLIFAEAGTNIIANIGTVSFSGPTCASLVNTGLTTSLGGQGRSTSGLPTTIQASFTPNLPRGGLTLSQAAADCGLSAFDWKQTITSWPAPSGLTQFGNPIALVAPPNFNDYPLGGYDYCNPASPSYVSGRTDCSTRFPFYYDATTLTTACSLKSGGACLVPVESSNALTDDTLNFFDSPQDPLLPTNGKLSFQTRLVGVEPGFDPSATADCLILNTCVDLNVGFDWTDTYNGVSGGISPPISIPGTDVPADPGGSGGITITAVFGGNPPVEPVTEPPSLLIFTLGFVAVIWSRKRTYGT